MLEIPVNCGGVSVRALLFFAFLFFAIWTLWLRTSWSTMWCLTTGCVLFLSLFLWTPCVYRSGSGYVSCLPLLCNSSSVNLVSWTHYRLSTNIVISEQYYQMLYSLNFTYSDLTRCALTREENYCIINFFSCLGLMIRIRASNPVKRRSLIVLMLLMSGNVPPNLGPHIASNFTTPIELKSTSGLRLNIRSLLPKFQYGVYLG